MRARLVSDHSRSNVGVWVTRFNDIASNYAVHGMSTGRIVFACATMAQLPQAKVNEAFAILKERAPEIERELERTTYSYEIVFRSWKLILFSLIFDDPGPSRNFPITSSIRRASRPRYIARLLIDIFVFDILHSRCRIERCPLTHRFGVAPSVSSIPSTRPFGYDPCLLPHGN